MVTTTLAIPMSSTAARSVDRRLRTLQQERNVPISERKDMTKPDSRARFKATLFRPAATAKSGSWTFLTLAHFSKSANSSTASNAKDKSSLHGDCVLQCIRCAVGVCQNEIFRSSVCAGNSEGKGLRVSKDEWRRDAAQRCPDAAFESIPRISIRLPGLAEVRMK